MAAWWGDQNGLGREELRVSRKWYAVLPCQSRWLVDGGCSHSEDPENSHALQIKFSAAGDGTESIEEISLKGEPKEIEVRDEQFSSRFLTEDIPAAKSGNAVMPSTGQWLVYEGGLNSEDHENPHTLHTTFQQQGVDDVRESIEELSSKGEPKDVELGDEQFSSRLLTEETPAGKSGDVVSPSCNQWLIDEGGLNLMEQEVSPTLRTTFQQQIIDEGTKSIGKISLQGEPEEVEVGDEQFSSRLLTEDTWAGKSADVNSCTAFQQRVGDDRTEATEEISLKEEPKDAEVRDGIEKTSLEEPKVAEVRDGIEEISLEEPNGTEVPDGIEKISLREEPKGAEVRDGVEEISLEVREDAEVRDGIEEISLKEEPKDTEVCDGIEEISLEEPKDAEVRDGIEEIALKEEPRDAEVCDGHLCSRLSTGCAQAGNSAGREPLIDSQLKPPLGKSLESLGVSCARDSAHRVDAERAQDENAGEIYSLAVSQEPTKLSRKRICGEPDGNVSCKRKLQEDKSDNVCKQGHSPSVEKEADDGCSVPKESYKQPRSFQSQSPRRKKPEPFRALQTTVEPVDCCSRSVEPADCCSRSFERPPHPSKLLALDDTSVKSNRLSTTAPESLAQRGVKRKKPSRRKTLILHTGSGGPIIVDPHLSSKMRRHQREGVKFLFDCVMGLRNPYCKGCILADDMGLGKTLQVIPLIWTLLKQGICQKPTVKKVLIVCPASLVENWGKEIQK